VTTVVLSMVAQSASVDAIRTCLVREPNCVVNCVALVCAAAICDDRRPNRLFFPFP
jgi:hypothetical protein